MKGCVGKLIVLGLLFLSGLLAAAPGSPEPGASIQRIALVIGNANYKEGRLANPVNDATDMGARLKELGFKVTTLLDADLRRMKDAIRDFTDRLYAQEGSVGLFYYAGHGLELDRQNYLLPINADIRRESDVEYEAVNAGRLLDGMMRAKNGTNLVILDACRNNPFSRGFRSVSRGLAEMRPSSGTLVLYATEPGKVASDGAERNGLFTSQLLQTLREPGLSAEQVFKQTALRVHETSSGHQTPWQEGVILGNFYFLPPTAPTTTASLPPPPPPPATAAFGHLQLLVNAPDTEVSLKGQPLGRGGPGQPINLANLPVGNTEVTLKAPGHRTEQRTLIIEPDRWTQTQVALLPETQGQARLKVRSNVSGDRVFIDGKDYGPTKVEAELPAGEHRVRVEKPDHQPHEESLILTAGETRTLTARLTPVATLTPRSATPTVSNTPQVPSSAKGTAETVVRKAVIEPQVDRLMKNLFR